MAHEIEHKYLVKTTDYRELASGCDEIIQGYIDRTPEHIVRVRKRGSRCFLAVKGKNHGDVRLEFEYEIPEADFLGLLSLCNGRILHKYRWIVPYSGFTWEVDEYMGHLKGLILAEIELPASDTSYPLPSFVGENVTDNPRYYNSNL